MTQKINKLYLGKRRGDIVKKEYVMDNEKIIEVSDLQVLKSGAGYYVGHTCLVHAFDADGNKLYGYWDRLDNVAGYWETEEEAAAWLERQKENNYA